MNSTTSHPGGDEDILDLYFARDERAIRETDRRYGGVCMQVSMGILSSRPDAEECVNDTYLETWNRIPPARPKFFCAFICRIVRNISVSRLRHLTAAKRSRDLTVSLEELSAVLPTEAESEGEVTRHISDFLRGETELDRRLFLGRYWFAQSVAALADTWEIPAKTVSQKLFRTRERLRVYLSERGYRV